eukprot:710900-Pelagomonas_calceolata.AAC.3
MLLRVGGASCAVTPGGTSAVGRPCLPRGRQHNDWMQSTVNISKRWDEEEVLKTVGKEGALCLVDAYFQRNNNLECETDLTCASACEFQAHSATLSRTSHPTTFTWCPFFFILEFGSVADILLPFFLFPIGDPLEEHGHSMQTFIKNAPSMHFLVNAAIGREGRAAMHQLVMQAA